MSLNPRLAEACLVPRQDQAMCSFSSLELLRTLSRQNQCYASDTVGFVGETGELGRREYKGSH